MVLYVIPVPDPPVGQDWRYTIPGQYLERITSVTATLVTGGNQATTEPDVSGNGYDATYLHLGGVVTFVPGLVVGDLAWKADAGPPFPTFIYCEVAANILDWTGDWSVCWWTELDPALLGGGLAWFISYGGPAGSDLTIRGNGIDAPGSGPPLTLSQSANVWTAPDTVLYVDGLRHFVAVTRAGGTLTLYVDGVAVPWATTGAVFPFGAANTHARWSDDFGTAGVIDEGATFAAELSPLEVANLYDLRDVFTDYSDYLLSLGPTAYYHFDGELPSTPRQVALDVTNGTELVERIPTGFAEGAEPGPYRYTWQPTLHSSTQTPSGLTTAVAIPPLILPAGYTIGARTLDIEPTDQWRDVIIWWDSDAMDSMAPVQPYAYPPGALLAWRGHRE